MNTSFFIANSIIKGDKQNSRLSKPIIKIAVLGITLGIAVMLLAIAIVTGFKSQIRDKVIGFGSHIQILHYDTHNYLEPTPINQNQDFLPLLQKHNGIRHIQKYAIKPGIIKTAEDIEGVLLKGIGKDFDWSFFNDKIVEGTSFIVTDSATTNDIIISKKIATKLKLNVGDHLLMYFIEQPPRVRKFNITGIYQTGLEEFDKLYVISDIKQVQKLNNWDEKYISGFELFLNDYNELETIAEEINQEIGYDLNAQTVKETNAQIFDWLDLQDINVRIILSLMLLVAGINMIATLLILILEKTNTIGILKALGMKDFSIQKIFLYNATYIIGKGLIFGNIIGLGLCFLQDQFKIVKLDETSYYLSSVPIQLELTHVLFLNLGTLLICLLMLMLPSYIISRISPVKAIRFR
ncbi:MAG: ABC transporter permease [Bacteroidota bacterium]|nr:ABC transporter permease [Bacteroidota bacterium]